MKALLVLILIVLSIGVGTYVYSVLPPCSHAEKVHLAISRAINGTIVGTRNALGSDEISDRCRVSIRKGNE
jgi:hypothetical protein